MKNSINPVFEYGISVDDPQNITIDLIIKSNVTKSIIGVTYIPPGKIQSHKASATTYIISAFDSCTIDFPNYNILSGDLNDTIQLI